MATTAEIQTSAILKIDALVKDSQALMDALKEKAMEALYIDGIDIPIAAVDDSGIKAVNAAAGALLPPQFLMWASQMRLPEAGEISEVLFPEVGNAPEFVAAEPIINLPLAPNAALPGAPGAAPEFLSPTTPDTPTFTLPDAPVFAPVNVPVIPEVSFPAFNELPPDEAELLQPTQDFVYVEGEYDRTLLDPLRAELLDNLLNGGYGIDTDDEQRLWERARDREMMANNALIEDTIRKTAARGFVIPPGAMNALIQQAQQTSLEKMSSLSREIMIKKTDMYVDNRKFTIQQIKEVEDMLYKYWSFAQERVLNAAKYVAEFGIQLSTLAMSKYNARVAAYQVKAQVFDTVIKAALANLESYKIKMDGVRIEAELQQVHAQVYRTQIEGVTALLNVYKTEVEAAQIKAEIERIKLEAFRSSVEAYTAQVQAKSAEFSMYKARIDGEMSKVEIFKAQAAAFGERIRAYSSRVQAADTEVKARVSSSQLVIEKYRSEIEGYRAALEAAQTDIRAMSEKYTNDLRKYELTVGAYAKVSEEKSGVSKANAEIAISRSRELSAHILGQANALTAHSNMNVGAAGQGLKGYGLLMQGLASGAAGITADIKNS